MKIKSALLGGSLLALVMACGVANATVVTFDDLPDGLVPSVYDGINWGSNWSVYSGPQSPYTAESSPSRIYTNYAFFPPGSASVDTFSFVSASVFKGAYVAGYGGFGPVTFDLYNGANLVAVSASLSASATPTFLSSGYSGLVTSVGVSGAAGYYVLDNVTYNAVPETSTWVMMLAGFAGLGFLGYRRNKAATLAA
jgi:hypothetical protein